jgi:hypothetical protein
VGRHKKRESEDEYGGCILYPYMKIEELNLLKLFQDWGREEGEQ